jgi:hypothetical protein
MQVSFERGSEIAREARQLPAEHYKKILLLFSRCHSDSLFVPIRSMQYLAVIDREEIVFVDGQGPRVIEVAWRDFHPGEREDLRAPVSYTCIFYEPKGRTEMARLQGEFFKALELLEGRQNRPRGATVTHLDKY